MNEKSLARPPTTRLRTSRFHRSLAIARTKAAIALIRESEEMSAGVARELRALAARELLRAVLSLELADRRDEQEREVA